MGGAGLLTLSSSIIPPWYTPHSAYCTLWNRCNKREKRVIERNEKDGERHRELDHRQERQTAYQTARESG